MWKAGGRGPCGEQAGPSCQPGRPTEPVSRGAVCRTPSFSWPVPCRLGIPLLGGGAGGICQGGGAQLGGGVGAEPHAGC